LKKCNAIKQDGGRCERIVGPSQNYCYSHDPNRAEERRQAASKAARAKNAGSELVEIKAHLKEIAEGVVEGTLQTGRGSVVSQIYGVLLRAIEQERKIKELEEFEARIEALEQAQQEGDSRRWRA
jgi:hypothetical protein